MQKILCHRNIDKNISTFIYAITGIAIFPKKGGFTG